MTEPHETFWSWFTVMMTDELAKAFKAEDREFVLGTWLKTAPVSGSC